MRGGDKKGTNGTIGRTVQLDSYKGQHVRGSIISASRHGADPGNGSSSSIEGDPVGRRRREGEDGGQMPSSARVSNVQRVVSFLFVGCFAFGGYLIYALTLGRYSRLLLAHMRRKIGVFRGKDVTGVHVAELCMTAWSLLCVGRSLLPPPYTLYLAHYACPTLTALTSLSEAATYTHLSIILPLVTCDDMLMQGPPEGEGFTERAGASEGAPSCEGSWSLAWRHFVPSAYFHVCFYFNWCACPRHSHVRILPPSLLFMTQLDTPTPNPHPKSQTQRASLFPRQLTEHAATGKCCWKMCRRSSAAHRWLHSSL